MVDIELGMANVLFPLLFNTAKQPIPWVSCYDTPGASQLTPYLFTYLVFSVQDPIYPDIFILTIFPKCFIVR